MGELKGREGFFLIKIAINITSPILKYKPFPIHNMLH